MRGTKLQIHDRQGTYEAKLCCVRLNVVEMETQEYVHYVLLR